MRAPPFDARVLGVAFAAGLIGGAAGVPWTHATLAAIAVVLFRLALDRVPALRSPTPVPAPASPQRRLAGPRGDAITPAELEVALLIARGLSTHEIAAKRFVSEKTVETQVQSLFNKLDIHNRAQLAAWVAANGLLAERPQPAPRP